MGAKTFAISGPWIGLLALLTLCLAHGLTVTRGLAMPPDLDALRDIGFAQGILDGNWFGDPAYENAARYYPPLVPALAAGLAALTRSDDLPGLWVAAGPWVGLLPVLGCFVLARRLMRDAAALMPTACFVVWNGALAAPWIGGGYSPWLLAPVLAQALFFATAALMLRPVSDRPVGRSDVVQALLVGAAIGLTFLAHIIPALLLSAMLLATALVQRGFRWQTLALLAVAAGAQLAVMSIYLLPLLWRHPAGVVHAAPGAWTDAALRGDGLAVTLGLTLPVVLAACLCAWQRARIPVAVQAMLAAGLGVCLLFLLRHASCAAADPQMLVCRTLRMPVHHFALYVQVLGALLIGVAASVVAGNGLQRALIAAALLIGGWALQDRDYDRRAHDAPPGMDLAAYRWVRHHVAPEASFYAAGDVDFDPGAFAIMAAGRRLVATHALFSNPYVDWHGREARRLAWLADRTAELPCDGRRQGFAILPTGMRVAAARPVFESDRYAVYELAPPRCAG